MLLPCCFMNVVAGACWYSACSVLCCLGSVNPITLLFRWVVVQRRKINIWYLLPSGIASRDICNSPTISLRRSLCCYSLRYPWDASRRSVSIAKYPLPMRYMHNLIDQFLSPITSGKYWWWAYKCIPLEGKVDVADFSSMKDCHGMRSCWAATFFIFAERCGMPVSFWEPLIWMYHGIQYAISGRA